MESTLKVFGNSIGLVIPKLLRESNAFFAGQKVEIQQMEDGILIRASSKRKRYSLDELLAQCDTQATRTDDVREWEESGAVGREEW